MKSPILHARRKGGSAKRFIKASAWLIAALVVGMYILVQSSHAFQVIRAGGETTARIIQTSEHDVEDDRGRVGTITAAVYEFFVDGGRFTGETNGAFGMWAEGDRISVQYNPENPTHNRAKGDRAIFGELFLKLICGGLFIYWAFNASGGIQALVALAPDSIPQRNEITLNSRVLGFSFLVSLATGIIFGLFPALHASRVNLNEGLKEGAGRATRASPILRNTFMVTQLSVAFVLLIGAGLMFRSFVRLQQVNTGFSSENLLTMRVQLPVVSTLVRRTGHSSSSRQRSGSRLYLG